MERVRRNQARRKIRIQPSASATTGRLAAEGYELVVLFDDECNLAEAPPDEFVVYSRTSSAAASLSSRDSFLFFSGRFRVSSPRRTSFSRARGCFRSWRGRVFSDRGLLLIGRGLRGAFYWAVRPDCPLTFRIRTGTDKGNPTV